MGVKSDFPRVLVDMPFGVSSIISFILLTRLNVESREKMTRQLGCWVTSCQNILPARTRPVKNPSFHGSLKSVTFHFPPRQSWTCPERSFKVFYGHFDNSFVPQSGSGWEAVFLTREIALYPGFQLGKVAIPAFSRFHASFEKQVRKFQLLISRLKSTFDPFFPPSTRLETCARKHGKLRPTTRLRANLTGPTWHRPPLKCAIKKIMWAHASFINQHLGGLWRTWKSSLRIVSSSDCFWKRCCGLLLLCDPDLLKTQIQIRQTRKSNWDIIIIFIHLSESFIYLLSL